MPEEGRGVRSDGDRQRVGRLESTNVRQISTKLEICRRAGAEKASPARSSGPAVPGEPVLVVTRLYVLRGERDLDRAVELLDRSFQRMGPSGEPSPASAAREADGNVFRREGDYWTIAFGGEVVRLRDTKGLRYLAYLLRDPGGELHVADLVGLLHPGEAVRPTTGDAGEVLDARARASYRERLEDLRDELEEAERFNDLGRAARAREEIDAIGAGLCAAVGLGGRARRAGSDSERARLMVTQRIRGALRKIRATAPGLGRHLDASIKTGHFCSYAPEGSVLWRL